MTDPVLYPLLLVGACVVASLWLAWRARLPTLLVALPVGLLIGPVLGLVPTSMLSYGGMRTFVIAVAGIWLFSLGRRARFSTWSEDTLALRLQYTGALMQALLIAAAGVWLLEWPIALALLSGGLLAAFSVYALGPLMRDTPLPDTLTTPLHYEARIGAPFLIGLFILGVSVVHVVQSPIEPPATSQLQHIGLGIGLDVFTALGISGMGVAVLLGILRWVQRPAPAMLATAALLVWIGLFIADYLQHGPGLLVPLLMGGFLAYQPWVQPTRALRVPDELFQLVVALLGVVIGASLSATVWEAFDSTMILFAAAVFMIRPVALITLWWGTRRPWRDAFVLGSWHPRGVLPLLLAVAVVPFVGHWYPALSTTWLSTLAFVTLATVAVTALLSRAVSHLLVNKAADPQTLLFVGANATARTLAAFLQARGFPVHLIDDRSDAVATARNQDLPATNAELSSPGAYDRLPLHDIGRVLLTVPDRERLHNATAHALGAFPQADIIGLRPTEDIPMPKGVPSLGDAAVSHQWMDDQLNAGAGLYAFRPGDILPGDTRRASYDAKELKATFEDALATPLFIIHEQGALTMVGPTFPATVRASDRIVLLMRPPNEERDDIHAA